jgi:microcompartment protein CcmL/EutN
MSISIGLIESKGIVAIIEAADVILKNSPVTILGIHKLENGLVSLAVSGNSDYVKAAIESGAEAGRRVGEIYASSVVDNPGKELLEIFGELFPSNEIFILAKDDIISTKIASIDKNTEETSNLFASVIKKVKTESKREKSKPLQVTKITPAYNVKKNKEQTDNLNKTKLIQSFEDKIEEDKKNTDETEIISESTKPLSTIERLRIEALGLESKKKKSKEISLPINKKNDKDKNVSAAIQNGIIDFEAISKMNVHKLRHYAREFQKFPIKGREISRANRDELVELFKSIQKN